jgi:hypothetical protein
VKGRSACVCAKPSIRIGDACRLVLRLSGASRIGEMLAPHTHPTEITLAWGSAEKADRSPLTRSAGARSTGTTECGGRFVKPARGSSRSRTGGARHDDDEFKRLSVRVTDARLDALIARGYLAANEREDDLAVREALQAFLADRLSGGHLH